ncbi:hypothetical protein SDC9_89443 [bioreactor metagenome]|uniref:Uncharacterized protein n=1 Tax=bioreactor metagenome TaxID=1076179 RepID=A0A644ZPJ7_9ZZZZ
MSIAIKSVIHPMLTPCIESVIHSTTDIESHTIVLFSLTDTGPRVLSFSFISFLLTVTSAVGLKRTKINAHVIMLEIMFGGPM